MIKIFCARCDEPKGYKRKDEALCYRCDAREKKIEESIKRKKRDATMPSRKLKGLKT